MAEQVIEFVKKRFSFQVTTPNQSYPMVFELDRSIKIVRGLLMSADQPNMMFYRGSQQITLNGLELFPAGYESKLLMSGISIPPDQKYVDLGDVLAGNGELKLNFVDADNPMQYFSPYIVSIYLNCMLA